MRALLASGAAVLATFGFGIAATTASAEFSTKKVAYIFEKASFPCGLNGCGVNDTGGPGTGGSIFDNAVTGSAPGAGEEAEYTPSGGEKATFKNVALEELDTNPNVLETGGYDTAILYETCAIASHPAAMAEINAFLEHAHKVMIFDADACSPEGKGQPNWGAFVFPFATNNPGPQGASGPYTAVEPSSLTTGLSPGVQEGDSVGDANVFTTPSLKWFQAIEAENVHGIRGTVMAYSRTVSGGLALYEGEDFWFTFGPTAHLKQVFDNMLNQHWNPDKLPSTRFACRSCASSVTTKLSSTIAPAGLPVTDSATVAGTEAPAGTATGSVTFTVYSDPNCQLPVAGQAQTVTVAAGAATTAPITLPAGTYYLQAQYFGDLKNAPGISTCGTEVLIVVPDSPPIEKHPPKVLEGGEIEWEVEFPEPGEAEFEAEVQEEAELSSAHGLGASALAAKHHKGCKKGFVKKHKKCVSRAPLRYGQGKLAITAPGAQKLRFKPSSKVLNALKKGKKLRVRLKLVFTPAQTTVHIPKTASVKLHLIKKPKHHHHHKK
jgi:hypothetical protein